MKLKPYSTLVIIILGIITMVSGCASMPVVDTSNAVSDPSHIIGTTEKEIEQGTLVKEELDSSDQVYMNPEPVYFSPYDCYSIQLNSGVHKTELRSLGNMLAFNKSIMIPVITVFDEKGNIIDLSVELYEVRSNSIRYPVHVYSLQTFELSKAQTVYIMINADMSSEDRVVASGYGLAGAIPFSMTLPLNRAPYAKYEITVE